MHGPSAKWPVRNRSGTRLLDRNPRLVWVTAHSFSWWLVRTYFSPDFLFARFGYYGRALGFRPYWVATAIVDNGSYFAVTAVSACWSRSFTNSSSNSSRISASSSMLRPFASSSTPSTMVCLLPSGQSEKLPRSFHQDATGPERC